MGRASWVYLADGDKLRHGGKPAVNLLRVALGSASVHVDKIRDREIDPLLEPKE
jgi:hypothetical protein